MDGAFLAGTALFRGIQPEEIGRMLEHLGASERSYRRGEAVFLAGEAASQMGLVLSGSVNIELDDLWGNKQIFGHVTPGQVFGETYACVPGEPMLVSAVADEPAAVLFLDMQRLLAGCPSLWESHSRLIRNLVGIFAQKNLTLSQRMMHTSSKSIRGRLLSYLSMEAERQGGRRFEIPYNRQQLADYLSLDRSALSRELGNMKRDGLLDYRKNYFVLKETLRHD